MTDFSYREVSCQKDVSGAAFSRGLQDYNFSSGIPNAWIPSKTFFRVDMTITAAGAVQPSIHEQIAFADNAVSCLYDNCFMRAGGQDVSNITQFAPQASQAQCRLNKTGAWLDTVGGVYLKDPSFQNRVNLTSTGVQPTMTKQGEYLNISKSDGTAWSTATISILQTTGAVTGVNTGLLDKGVTVGDTLVLLGLKYTVTAAPTDNVGTGMLVVPIPAATIVGNADTYVIRKQVATGGSRNEIFTLFQPPIGIFGHDGMLGGGQYKFQLNPNADYKSACIESRRAGMTAGTEWDVTINDVRLYVATVKASIPDQVSTIHLHEMQVQSKVIASSGNNVLHFTVPPSTMGLAVFLQSNDAGSNPLVPPTNFKCKDDSQNNLTSIQVTYNNTTKPSTRWTSAFNKLNVALPPTPAINQLQHRYMNTISNTGMVENEAGAESFDDWMMRGPLMYYNFERDENNLSTEVQLQVDYATPEAGANVFLVAFYRKSTQITTSNGAVVRVESLIR